MSLNIAFRVDSSSQIGSGHLVRCLALADRLRERGDSCEFICRAHRGHRIDLIRARGFPVDVLPPIVEESFPELSSDSVVVYKSWLGTSRRQDAAETIHALGRTRPDWLIVDHYAIDATWENILRERVDHILVIDDLADRKHDADVLLDQNLGRRRQDYASLVSARCDLLIGPKHALLRPEFAELREYSLARRSNPRFKRLLISMGGVDADNATGHILAGLQQAIPMDDLSITVVMGSGAPWLSAVRKQTAESRWPCEVHVDVTNMAQLMADSDLAIGAAGGTSWERCCLGVPSIIVILADNQREAASALTTAGAGHLLGGKGDDIAAGISSALVLLNNANSLKRMSRAAAKICDGLGLARILDHLHQKEAFNKTVSACRVRIMVEGDLEQVLRWRNHPDIRKYMYTQHEISLAEHKKWYGRVSQESCNHLLIVEEDGVALGFVKITEIRPGGVAEWGFYVAPGSAKGTGRKLGSAALTYAFESLRLHKVCGQALDSNERSIALHRSLGFKEEGIQHGQHFDGEQYHSIYCFGLLSSDWNQQH